VIEISIDDIPDDVVIVKKENHCFKIVDINNSMLAYVPNLTKESLFKSTLEEILEDFDTQLLKDYLHVVYEAGESLDFDFACNEFLNKKCRWHKGSIRKLSNEKLIIFFKNRDKLKDIELVESKEKFDKIAQSSFIGVFVYQEHFVYVNKAFEKLSGYESSELCTMHPWKLASKVHQKYLQDIVYKRLSGSMFHAVHEDVPLIQKNGKQIYVRISSETIKYKGAYAAIGTVEDVTQNVLNNKKIKQLAQALEQTDDMLLISDLKGKITYVNETLIKTYGYTKEELIGTKTSILKSGLHDENFYKNLWATILSGKKYKNILKNKTKSGKLIDVNLIITPVFDKSGMIESFVSTSQDVTMQTKNKKMLEQLATKDTLTKVNNRYATDKALERLIEEANEYESTFAVVMIDIDYFKKINDTYGHYVGDVVLKELSAFVEKNIRKIDIFGRWGGEEFLLFFVHIDRDVVYKKAQELCKKIEQLVINKKYKITVSMGVTLYKNGESKEELLDRVDAALYRAKHEGRNQVVFQ
jgi:diguanylate cyclase (GGDEF)-like protein/PAS domain S-box-containing protein